VSATRRDVLLGGAALLVPAGAVRAATAAGAARAAPAAGDAVLLENLLAHERRLESAYDLALRRDLLDPAAATTLRDQERAHIRGLEQTLSRMGRPRRAAPMPVQVPRRRPFARFALDLESRTIDAYLDALGLLRSTSLLLPIGSIAANQGQHAVILRDMLGLRPLEESLAVS
jgi:hypothetical protein